MVLDTVSQDALMARSGHTIEDHAFELDIRIELNATGYHGSHGPCGLGAVDTQDQRQIKQFGQLGGAGFSAGIDAVVQPPVAFNHGNIGITGMSVKRLNDGL